MDNFKKESGLVCIDWQAAELELAGTWASGDSYSALQVALVPCHTRQTLQDGSLSEIREECNLEEAAAWDYLQDLSIVVYTN